MKRRLFMSALAAPLVLGGCGFKPFYFIQMADTQLGMIAGGDNGDNFAPETDIMEEVIADINAMTPKPVFVIVCGDLTNLPAHTAQIDEYKRLVSLIDPSIRWYHVSGNHDFKGNPTAETLAFYRNTFGPDRYTFDYDGWRFIVLNSSLMKFPEDCPEEADKQFEWAKEVLADAGVMRGSVVFMHHPFFDNDIEEEDGYHSITKAYRRKWLDLFAGDHVNAVYSGHRHTTIPEHIYKGVRLINTNAICNSFDNRPGLRIVSVSENSLNDRLFAREDIPATVTIG